MTSFVGYVNNNVIKPIYFKSHMRIDEQIIKIIPNKINVFIQGCDAYKHNNSRNCSWHICFRKKYLRQQYCDFDVCKLSSTGDVVYKERLWHCHNLVNDLFYAFVIILFV